MEKCCLRCGKTFKKRQNYSVNYWKNAKYCSVGCASSITKNRLGKTGAKHTDEAKKKIGIASRSRNTGRSDLKRNIYNLLEYRNWRKAVYERDNYTCQSCFKRGGRLDCHHIEALSHILNKNNIKTPEDAVLCTILWDLNNGLTLCRKCHELTDNYAHKAMGRDLKTGKFTKIPEPGI